MRSSSRSQSAPSAALLVPVCHDQPTIPSSDCSAENPVSRVDRFALRLWLVCCLLLWMIGLVNLVVGSWKG